MISRRTTTTLNDDHGDQFPGAVPALATSAPARADEQFVRMHAAYVQKVNAAVQADREGLAHELAERTFAEESLDPALDGARPRPIRERLGRFARALDSYTLEVFNPGAPSGRHAQR
ncbi:MAG TPA: hypothetical protein VGN28_01605 [Blastococcus sp.]|jgi:hypothetical protein|nr:hypothetical protein [Blastococcus sp.]